VGAHGSGLACAWRLVALCAMCGINTKEAVQLCSTRSNFDLLM
jgi:hypothetical protein